MTAQRPGAPGATRVCPHCAETILESAAICPVCRHHLRFEPGAATDVPLPGVITPLRVEGSIRHPAEGGAWEYSMVLTIRNERGEDLARRIVGVGALLPGEQRNFVLSVEMTPTGDRGTPKRPRH